MSTKVDNMLRHFWDKAQLPKHCQTKGRVLLKMKWFEHTYVQTVSEGKHACIAV